MGIEINDDHESASLELKGGDKLTGVLNLGPIELETIFGGVEVCVVHIKRIVVAVGASAVSLPHLPQELTVGYHLMTGDVSSLPLHDADTSFSFETRTWQLHQPEGYVTFFELPTQLAITPPTDSKTGAVDMNRHLFIYGTKVGVYTSGTADASTKPKILGSVRVQELRLTFDGTWKYEMGGGGKIFVHTTR